MTVRTHRTPSRALALLAALAVACGDAPVHTPAEPERAAAPRTSPGPTDEDPHARAVRSTPAPVAFVEPEPEILDEPASERWTAAGSVRAAAGGAGIAGVEIDLDLVLADGRARRIARAQTGADGAFTAWLPGLAQRTVGERAGARVVARARAAGFRPARAAVALDAGLGTGTERRVVLALSMAEGATLRARAVDALGAAVPRAAAAISLQDGRSGPGGLTLVDEAEAGDDGRFELGFAAGGTLLLSVRADGVGVILREIAVEARVDLDAGDVVLGGGDRLAGIALHVDGTPAKNVELWAIQGEGSFQSDAVATAVRRAREVERNEGLSWSRTFTDEGGFFEFRALRPDQYSIKAGDPSVVVEPRQARFQPGQTDLELRVETPILVVRVVDERGAPAHGAFVEATELGVDVDGAYIPGSTRRAAVRGPRALAAFSADPETPLAVRARLGRRVSSEEIAFFGAGTQYVEEELALAPRAQGGRLRLIASDLDPAEVPMRVALASAVTSLRDEDLGVLEADATGLVTGIPPGSHRLIVDFSGERGLWFFPWRSREPVLVPAEGEAAVLVAPQRGARLAIECDLSGPRPAGLDDPSEPALRRERYGARFVLVPADGGQERSLDLVLGGESTFLLLPGETGAARDLLAPGDYDVRVEGARWMSTRTRVRLLAGVQLRAQIELRAR